MGFIPKSLPLSDLFRASRKTRKSQARRLPGSPSPSGLKSSPRVFDTLIPRHGLKLHFG